MHVKKISSREREILELIAHEYTTPQIATQLYLSTHTVDSHKKNIKVKLDVKNTAGMVRRGFELGLLSVKRGAQAAQFHLILGMVFFTSIMTAQEPFSMTFETQGADEKVIIPIQSGLVYDYQVDWDGDGFYDEQIQNSEASHTYASSGQHVVNIIGQFPAINYNNSSNVEKLVSINQWGSIKWESFDNAFYGAVNMKYNATDVPDLATVTDLSGMFRSCSLFDGDLSGWDISKITSLSTMFQDASAFNGDVTTWETGNVEFMLSTFSGASQFNRDIRDWNLQKATNTGGMFYGACNFNQPIGDWDVSMVGNMASMFRDATSFNQPLNNWDVSSVTIMFAMFEGASSFNQYINDWDVRDVITMQRMFNNASSFNRTLFKWRIENVNNLSQFLTGSNYGSSNYEKTLIFWSVRPRQNNVTLSVGDLRCCACAGRELLISESNWNIIDGGEDCDRPFIMTYRTTSPNEFIEIYTNDDFDYNYSVDWENDGVIDITDLTGDQGHFFKTPGDHQIAIYGDYPFRPSMSSFAEEIRNKVISIDQWGNIAWESFRSSFQSLPNLIYKAADHPDLSGVTSMTSMFGDSPEFDADIGDWDMRFIEDISFMFNGSSRFNGDISNWEVGNVRDMWRTFGYAESFNCDISQWDVSRVSNMNAMFEGATVFNKDISQWNVGNVQGMFQMFLAALNFNQPIGDWNTSKVNTMEGMFKNAVSFNQNIDDWDVSMVTNFSEMFWNANAYNQPLNNWELNVVDNITMREMFLSCELFDQDLNNWHVNKVTDMSGMFESAVTFDGSIVGWNTSSVVNMNRMFRNAESFNQPLNHLLTGSCTDMGSMFMRAESFNQPIINWNTTLVNNMNNMFFEATAFNQDVSFWNVRGVTSMNEIFHDASSFNQSLGDWDPINVTDMTDALSGTALSRDNYDATLEGWGRIAPDLEDDVPLGADGLEYCTALLWRAALEFQGWTIIGDSRNCESQSCMPEQIVYIGPDEGIWHEPSNWNPTRIPAECDEVTIGMGDNVCLTADASCGLLQILTGAEFDTGVFELTINGTTD